MDNVDRGADNSGSAGGGTGMENVVSVDSEGSLMPNWITSLEEELDKQLLVILRDGRHLMGLLRTFDHFGNLVLEDCVQRIVVDTFYSDIYLGCMIIRGENVLLLGAVDANRPLKLQRKPLYEVLQLQEIQEKEEQEAKRHCVDIYGPEYIED